MRCVDRRIEPGLRPSRATKPPWPTACGTALARKYDARKDTRIAPGTLLDLPAGAYQPTVSRPTRLWSASPRPKLSRRWASRPNWKLMAPPCTTAKL